MNFKNKIFFFISILASVLFTYESLTAATIESRIKEFGTEARQRWAPYFKKASVSYPPDNIVLYYTKSKRILEVFATPRGEKKIKSIRSLNVLAASGVMGPKLKEGDNQVPEGLYRIELLNPNSAFHVSLRVSYPNAFDRQKALLDKRQRLGGDIMIHGSRVSIGCLAMGDEVAEDLFTLAVDAPFKNWKLILSPVDFRTESIHDSSLEKLPKWTPELYKILKDEIALLPPSSFM